MCDCENSIQMIPFLPNEDVQVNLNQMKVVTGVVAAGAGFGGSNSITAALNRNRVENGKEAWSGTRTGWIKVGLGAITSLASFKYAPVEYAFEGVLGGIGMAVSGGLDIAKDNLPENVTQTVKDILGINGIHGVPIINPGLPGSQGFPQNRRSIRQQASSTSSITL